MKYAIAVLDIGKTNKKVAIYSDTMQPLAVRKRKIETIRKDGLDIEDVGQIEQWFLDRLKELAQEFPVRVISVTTHGASLVCVGEDGHPAVPPVAYTNEVSDLVHQSFWDTAGDPHEVQKTTATAEVKPLINAGKLLWFLKQRWPDDFARIKKILFFPQYFGFRLTGKTAADITYAGCHSYLWDFTRQDWSSLTDTMGIRSLLPEKPGLPNEQLGTLSPEIARQTGLPEQTPVTLGIHDSNSSLIPYLISQEQDFVLNSTGTWCVAMHPAEKVDFRPEELGKMVFYNLDYQGKPVKTSILLGGLEYSVYTDALMARHKRSDWPGYDAGVYKHLLKNPETFLLPTIVPGTGQFPDSTARVIDGDTVIPVAGIQNGTSWPDALNDYHAGFALANLSLAIQTRIALQRVGLSPGTEIFIEGGFRQNQNYTALLGALLPENPVYLTALEEATSFGAALCGKSLADSVPVAQLKDFVRLQKVRVEPARLENLETYVDAFLGHLADCDG